MGVSWLTGMNSDAMRTATQSAMDATALQAAAGSARVFLVASCVHHSPLVALRPLKGVGLRHGEM
jgi:hypothetical protein